MDWLLGGPNLWFFLPVYIIGPVIGAVLAAFFYDWIRHLIFYAGKPDLPETVPRTTVKAEPRKFRNMSGQIRKR